MTVVSIDARMLHSRIYEDANKVRIMNDQFSMFDSPADVESAAPKSAPNWMPNYARLYGLTRDELRYILDLKEVHGEDSSTLPAVAGRVSLAKPSAC